MTRYMDTHELPVGITEAALKERLTAFAEIAHANGVHTVETFYNVDLGRAHCIVDAVDEEAVRESHESAELPVTDIMPVARIHTDLLDEPRRARFP